MQKSNLYVTIAAVGVTVATLLAIAPSSYAAPGEKGHAHASFAAGEPGNAKRPARQVIVTLKETEDGKMLYSPDRIQVKRGEQIKFVLKNVGAIEHEFVLDSIANNEKHKIEMQKNPDMEHDDPNAKRLTPGKSTELIWRFTKAGEYEFACLIPGHHESGMKGTIVVK